MQDGFQDPRFDRRYDAGQGHPVGIYPIPAGSRLRAVECVHCAHPVGVSTWDYLNGFLVVCPHCGGHHGKAWTFQRTLVAGLFLNALSFFLVMRPRRALGVTIAFALLGWGLLSLAAADDVGPYVPVALGTVLLGPVLINAVALVRHQMLLDRAPPDDAGNPGG